MTTPNAKTNTTPAISQTTPQLSAAAKSGLKAKSGPPSGKSAPKSLRESKTPSKQDRVVAMLRRPEGTTVEAVMKVTGWLKHSVHGFFAGVVRKKLGFSLVSARVDGKRTYRIAAPNGGKSSKGGKQTKAAMAARKPPKAR